MPNPKWAIGIQAHPMARLILEEHLRAELIEIPGDHGGLYLAHPSLNTATTPDEARTLANQLIPELNGAIALVHSNVPSVVFADVVRLVLPGGQLGPKIAYMAAEAGAYAVAFLNNSSSGGRFPGERAFDLIVHDPEFRSAATMFAAAGTDFRLLYIVAEFARDAASGKIGGSWKALEKKGWISATELDQFKQVANREHRHRPTPATARMTPGEARDLVARLVRGWLDWKMPH